MGYRVFPDVNRIGRPKNTYPYFAKTILYKTLIGCIMYKQVFLTVVVLSEGPLFTKPPCSNLKYILNMIVYLKLKV